MEAKKYLVFYDERFFEQAIAELRSISKKAKFQGVGALTRKTPIMVSFDDSVTIPKDTVFIDAILPIIFEIDGYDEDLSAVTDALAKALLGKGKFKIEAVRINSIPKQNAKSIEVKLGTALENRGIVASMDKPDIIVYLLLTRSKAVAALGNGGKGCFIADKFRETVNRKVQRISRSEFKLEEAAEYFKICLGKDTRVLDIGAAPGGWSKYCLEKGASVVALDAAAMDKDLVERYPQLTHIRKHAEDLDERSAEELGDFDILLLDMNIAPEQSAAVANRFSKKLVKEGILVMSIKLIDSNIIRHIEDTKEALLHAFMNIKVKKLPHNRMEVTLCAVKR